jgi:hypothetical protein
MRILVITILLLLAAAVHAQEAGSGFELRTTLTAGAAYSKVSSDAETGGFRALLYPTFKFDEHWAVTGVVQVHSRPFFFEELDKPGYGVRADVLAANLSYSRFWHKRLLVVRTGQLPSAFGSFLLRYDDAVNPLVDKPQAYGYYYNGVTTKGLAGAQVDAVIDRVDLRTQFTNSSPANPRSIFDKDQYGDWAGGAGYTIKQGFRAGASAYRGPYLDRDYPFFFRGEANPRRLPGSAIGADVQWAAGHWNVNGEWQYFHMDYRVIPTFATHTGYGEVRRVLHPRWYVAARLGYMRANAYTAPNVYEMAVGYRPNAHQLIKVEYEIQQSPMIHGAQANTLAVQVVTTLKPLTLSWR